MRVKLVSEANKGELVKFAEVAFQMADAATLHHETLRTKLKNLGVKQVTLFEEGPSGPTVPVRETYGDLSREETDENKERWVCINVAPDPAQRRDSLGGPGAVPVGINGSVVHIPRGRPVWVRGLYAKVLGDARVPYREPQNKMDPNGRGALTVPDMRDHDDDSMAWQQKYPYTVVRGGPLVREGVPMADRETPLVGPPRAVKEYRMRQRALDLEEFRHVTGVGG